MREKIDGTMKPCAFLFICIAIGCDTTAVRSHEFAIAAGDAFDLLRHLQEQATSSVEYYQTRHDDAQRAVDHLNRIATTDNEHTTVRSLQEYLAEIESARAIVDNRQSSLNEMRHLSVAYPYISQCRPPNPAGSPCARWAELKAHVAALNTSIAEQDEKATAIRSHVLVR